MTAEHTSKSAPTIPNRAIATMAASAVVPSGIMTRIGIVARATILGCAQANAWRIGQLPSALEEGRIFAARLESSDGERSGNPAADPPVSVAVRENCRSRRAAIPPQNMPTPRRAQRSRRSWQSKSTSAYEIAAIVSNADGGDRGECFDEQRLPSRSRCADRNGRQPGSREFSAFERPAPRDHDRADNGGKAGAEQTVQTQPFERRSDGRLHPKQGDQHSQTQQHGAGWLDPGARAPIDVELVSQRQDAERSPGTRRSSHRQLRSWPQPRLGCMRDAACRTRQPPLPPRRFALAASHKHDRQSL